MALTSLMVFGQTGQLFTVDRELSSSLVNCVMQDCDGVMWIGTEDGLNRYDGAKFVTYKHANGRRGTLGTNYVGALFQDRGRHFYVGTRSGLQLYDGATDTFSDIPLFDVGRVRIQTNVSCIMQRRNGEVMVGTSGYGVYKIHFGSKGIEANRLLSSTPDLRLLYTMFEDSHRRLWLSTEDAVLFCLTPDGHLKRYTCKARAGQPAENVTAICESRRGLIVAGTAQGLYLFNATSGTFQPLGGSLHRTFPVTTLHATASGDVWVGTDGEGMKCLNATTLQLTDRQFGFSNFDFSKAKIHAIATDHSGNCWLGIYQKGLMLLPSSASPFGYIGYKSLTQNIIGSCCVMSLCKDRSGNLWVGTDNDGLYGLRPDGKTAVHYRPGTVPATIMSIFEDHGNGLWLGSYQDGMMHFDTRTGRCDRPLTLADDLGNPTRRVYCFAQDRNLRLWVGTMGSGLFCIDPATHRAVNANKGSGGISDRLNNYWINCLLTSRDGRLYLGTFDGLACLNLRTMRYETQLIEAPSLKRKIIYALHEDAKGRLWVGCTDGLLCVDRRSGLVQRYTTHDGLPADVICSIRGDAAGDLWIGTNRGIAHYSQRKGTFNNYFASDGLQGNEFSRGASSADAQGNLYFGGMNGVTSFNPALVRNDARRPDIRITGFYIHDTPVHKGMESGHYQIVDTAVSAATLFHLCHTDNSFSIECSSMDYACPERIAYQYTMDGGPWVTLRQGTCQVSFSNLQPGTHHFCVRAKNYTSFSATRQIDIVIEPAWYASLWAKMVYALLVLLAGWFTFVLLRRRYRLRQEMQEHIHTERTNEAKLQFFINISHEIRTPMTLIISPLQKLMADDADTLRQRSYHIIWRNAHRILDLVNQLLDIRKIDMGQMALLFRQTNIIAFVEDLCDAFSEQADSKNIKLSLHAEVDELSAWIDPHHFDKVVMNLLSNAFKFTPEGGNIDLYLRCGDDEKAEGPLRHYFELVVSDNGIAINENEMTSIFQRFYQISNSQNNSNVGTGIGLHLTRSLVEMHHGTIAVANNTPDAGCRFIVRLPMGSDHLTAAELAPASDAAPDAQQQMVTPAVPQWAEGAADAEAPYHRVKTRYRILVAEDDEDIRQYLATELSDEFHIIQCANGSQALDLIFSQAPDLVVSDIMMPEMDGLTLCHKIKQNVNLNNIPVILLTAKTRQEDNLEGLDAGADAYLTKPFSLDILRHTAENLIHSREVLRNRFTGSQDQQQRQVDVEAGASPDQRLLDRLMKVINANIGNPDFTVEMLASEAGISRVHLHRKLKELTNQTTRDFIRNLRLKQAARLLAIGHDNISEISERVGFSNVSIFSRAFKETYGISPKAYREQKIEEE
jgi:signal transduction histidine kinase/ligand-binding sensor domain-containing protein/DNA-binding response OmpR family regulator